MKESQPQEIKIDKQILVAHLASEWQAKKSLDLLLVAFLKKVAKWVWKAPKYSQIGNTAH